MAINTIIFLDRDKLQIAYEGKIFTLHLTTALIKDMEIVNKDSLISEVYNFVGKNKIVFGTTLILLSEAVCFFSEEIKKDKDINVLFQEFNTMLPFETAFTISLGNRFVGVNKELYDDLVEAVQKSGGDVRAVSPLFIVSGMAGKKDLDDSVVKYVSDNENIFIKSSFRFENRLLPQVGIKVKSKENNRAYILIGVFIFLAIILVFLILRNI